jgi:nucleoside-diphosphate-sugar epimerase
VRIDEDCPLEPKWDYPKSKVSVEELILRERGDVPVVLMRIGAVYDDRCHSIPLYSRSGVFTKSGSSAVFFPATSRME